MTREKRRKLYLWSAPVCVLILLASLKLISVVVTGDSAREHFLDHDIGALSGDLELLQIADVIEPGRTAFAAGDLDVLTGRLPDAERHFAEALEHADSCPVRINLVLVRETLGDLAFQRGDRDETIRRYQEAMTVAREAPASCFDGNDDADEERRAVRADTVPRLQSKLDLVTGPAVAPPPPPPLPVAPPPAVPAPGGSAPAAPETEEPRRSLDGGSTEDRLRPLLDDANADGADRE
ncbi:hypothetical protein BH10ACT9_BH10ACT9_52290 [soil metagenome]